MYEVIEQEVLSRLKEIEVTDFYWGDGSSKVVHIKHTDGSDLNFNRAFIEPLETEGNWYCIYTEHHGYHIHHLDDFTIIE